MKFALTALPFAGLLLAGAAGCAHQGYQPYDGRDDREARGERRASMLELAEDLTTRAGDLARNASASNARSRAEREVRELAEAFAQHASRLGDRLQERRSRRDATHELQKLTRLAQKIDDRIRSGRVSQETYAAWRGVEQTLDALSRAADGGDAVYDER
jgi:hypothetical protein